MNFSQPEDILKEKIKELTCLYEISKIISRSNSVNIQTLREILITIKDAWRFNMDAVVEIHAADFHLSTSDSIENSIYQSSFITIDKKGCGFIKVHYPAQNYSKSDFHEDEQKLLDTAAIEIGNYFEKHKTLQLNDQLEKSIGRMERLTLLGEMTAGIAHELNTPLANILGFAELIKSQNTNPEIDSDISIVINAVMYSREIVKKLMFFSCEMPQKPELQEIKPIIVFALSFLKSNFQKKAIQCELLFKDENSRARFDSVQITQVLFNLLLNAIYASPEKSIVKIMVDHDEHYLLIKIEDYGTGIPEDIKDKIFEPFFSTKPVNYGCGLGLSVVHRIMKNHNGEIIIQNNCPQGSIFIIKIPIS